MRVAHARVIVLGLVVVLLIVAAAWRQLTFSVSGTGLAAAMVAGRSRRVDRDDLAHLLGSVCALLVKYRQACRGQYRCLVNVLLRQPARWLQPPRPHPWWSLFAWTPSSWPLPPLSPPAVQRCRSTDSFWRITPAALERVAYANQCPRDGKFLWVQVAVRDDARLLVENVLYHLSLGVEHFIIHDYQSTDNLRQALRPLVEAGLVTHRLVDGRSTLLDAYAQGLQIARQEGVRWLVALEPSEFFVSSRSSCISEILIRIEVQFPDTLGGYAVNRRAVYADAQLDAHDRLQPERSALSIGEANERIKSFGLVSRIRAYRDRHHVEYNSAYQGLSPNGRMVTQAFQVPPDAEDAALLHYVARSPIDWLRTSLPERRGDADAVRLLRAWLSFPVATPLPGHRLTRALEDNVVRLRRALHNVSKLEEEHRWMG